MKKKLFTLCMLLIILHSCQNGTTDTGGDVLITSNISCDAGDDQTISSLNTTVTLLGTVTDAATEDVTYSWYIPDYYYHIEDPYQGWPVPAGLMITDSDSSTATFETSLDWPNGRYEFWLKVDDGVNTALDKVYVTLDYLPKISAMDGTVNDFFGRAVSLSDDGNTALIGASNAQVSGVTTGAAYIFTRDGSVWTQKAKLTASDGAVDDDFGYSVSISGDGKTALIVAPECDVIDINGTHTNAGAAYIFGSDSWSDCNETAKLTVSDCISSDRLGAGSLGYNDITTSLSYDGSVALIGAPSVWVGSIVWAGYAYIFQSDSWTDCNETAVLTITSYEDYYRLGSGVALSADGQTALVAGVKQEAFIYQVAGDWYNCAPIAKLTASPDITPGSFGYSMALSADGSVALISAYRTDINSVNEAGAAYIFTSTSWDDCNQTALLTASDSSVNLGKSVSLSADGLTAFIGATGRAFLFSTESSWSNCNETDVIIQSYFSQVSDFGVSISISADASVGLIGSYMSSTDGAFYPIVF